ncbi:septum formation initiator [Shewanella putrefaciens]|nr:septum formation initiator [Shewanella putrefaciens]
MLSLSPEQLADAKAQNLPILSYLANVHNSGFVSYFGPFIAFIAIVSSFFGHYMGATEGMKGIIVKQLRSSNKSISEQKINTFIFVMLLCSPVCCLYHRSNSPMQKRKTCRFCLTSQRT